MTRYIPSFIVPALLALSLSGCGAAGAALGGALGGAALGTAAGLGSRALDGVERGAEAADDYITEGVAWRRELRVEMKAAVRDMCDELEGVQALECWHSYYPTLGQLKSGIFGKPLENAE